MAATDPLLVLKSMLHPEEIINPSSTSYASETLPWAAQMAFKPRLTIRPATIDSLSKVIAYISKTTLDFAVRSQGYGSASAKDVLISLTAFDEFAFDRENEIVTLGAGQPWGEYYRKMETVAPDYSVIACRTPCIGVGGSILCGGFSWLSAEYELTSDPRNMLDAQVVKLDGCVVWASTEPDLLWALRGAGASFGVVTAFKLRAYHYTTSIWAGPILFPRTQFQPLAEAAASFTERSNDPKVSMFMYVLKKELLPIALGIDQDMIVVHAFDAYGEKHGRSEEGFRWALEMEGIIDNTAVMNLRGVADLQANIAAAKGLSNSYWSSLATPEVTPTILHRCLEWFDSVIAAGGSVADSPYLLLELMQNSALSSSKSTRADSAWPRPATARHIILLGTGCSPTAPAAEDELAQRLCRDGHDHILGIDLEEDENRREVLRKGMNFVPNTVEEFHDQRLIYGEHWPKLRALKARYDPDGRLKGPITMGSIEVNA